MKERGIPFSPAMVRAILRGTKSQTRRVVKSQPSHPGVYLDRYAKGPEWAYWMLPPDNRMLDGATWPCPYGVPGDRLYVREPWATEARFDQLRPALLPAGAQVWREADSRADAWDRKALGAGRYRHAKFMPRRLSRLDLEVTEVRAQRLHALTEEDAIAEGIQRQPNSERWFGGYHRRIGAPFCTVHNDARTAYADLWDSINGEGSWATNPFVWAISFRVVTP